MPIIPDSRITKVINSKYQREMPDEPIHNAINIDILKKDENYFSICQRLSKNYQIDNNGNLMKNLENYGLLLNDNNICDCSIGLGGSLFDIYQQTINIQNKTFHFYGVEKNKNIIELFEENLRKFWPKIYIINDDIMNHDFSRYNIVFTSSEQLNESENIYLKIIDELPIFGILIENSNKGLGFQNCLIDLLQTHPQIEIIDVDGFVIYQKV